MATTGDTSAPGTAPTPPLARPATRRSTPRSPTGRRCRARGRRGVRRRRVPRHRRHRRRDVRPRPATRSQWSTIRTPAASSARPVGRKLPVSARDGFPYGGGVPSTLQALVLTEDQRAHYREHGWLSVARCRRRRVAGPAARGDRRVRRAEPRRSPSRTSIFDLDVGHSADEPRLRRLSSPTDLHETYWEFASTSPIVDVVVDLRRPGREVPPLEAQLQGGAWRRRGEVAPGHPVLAPHQLRPADDRRVPRGRRAGHG